MRMFGRKRFGKIGKLEIWNLKILTGKGKGYRSKQWETPRVSILEAIAITSTPNL